MATHDITPAALASFWSVVDLTAEHMADVFSEMPEGQLDPDADPVGELLYDAILYDAAKAAGVAKPKTAYKRKARRVAAALLTFNTSTSPTGTAALDTLLGGRPIARFTAQLGALEFLRVQAALLGAVHTRLRGLPTLKEVDDGGEGSGGAGAFMRGLSCVFLASGSEPFEAALRAPQTTMCMALSSEDPAELAQIGNIYCTSSLAARAQITAALATYATIDAAAAGKFTTVGGADGSSALLSPLFPPGSAAEQRWKTVAAAPAVEGAVVEGGAGGNVVSEEGGSSSAPVLLPPSLTLTEAQQADLMARVVAQLHAFDVEAFGKDGTPLEEPRGEGAADPAAPEAAAPSEEKDAGKDEL